jgi:hypothetical protein
MCGVCEAVNEAGCLGYLKDLRFFLSGVQGAPQAPGIWDKVTHGSLISKKPKLN